ncbi:DUF1440 domain-containing protein [Sphingomonas sp. MA1305]|uniref:DUF1440 domain-containing protein n=1 Tax=Sphingomonas sp. MA1305 TaxID=2479204 RepID=UPI0018DFDA0E|nr:DUF1440 domain-containing protein [Sphingomonas sp. MA1305]MBI0476288.1 DUF1440 domain-containing protein [Sphingomonas sp. MA1305]
MTQPSEQTVGARVVRGALAGIVAGVAASFAMDRFQALAGALSGDSDGSDEEPATAKAADAIVAHTVGGTVPQPDKPLAGQLVHYALGAALGVAYGIAAEFRPGVTAGYGSAFGTATAALLDEGAVPAAGLGAAPWNSPASTHLYGLSSHLVFGATAELVRAQVAKTLQPA